MLTRWIVGVIGLVGSFYFVAAGAAGASPLIDRELLFGDPELAAAQLSPTVSYIAFLKTLQRYAQYLVKGTQEAFDKARPLTADTKRPIPQFSGAATASTCCSLRTTAADENFNVYAVQPDAKPAAGKEVPDARNLTAAQGVRAQIYNLPKNDPDVFFVGINDRDKSLARSLPRSDYRPGERTLLRKNHRSHPRAGNSTSKANYVWPNGRPTKGDSEILARLTRADSRSYSSAPCSSPAMCRGSQ